jgi:hypothetical protein
MVAAANLSRSKMDLESLAFPVSSFPLCLLHHTALTNLTLPVLALILAFVSGLCTENTTDVRVLPLAVTAAGITVQEH